MKTLEKEKLQQLLQIIPSSPALRIMHFSDKSSILTKELSDLCKNKGYTYQLNCIDDAYYERVFAEYGDKPHVNIAKFDLDRPSYMMQGKVYEYLFVTAKIEAEKQGAFLKRAHRIIKNSGNILIFFPKGSHEERYRWTALLEEHYYVATSTIDDLFEHYDVTISKKMHGWK